MDRRCGVVAGRTSFEEAPEYQSFTCVFPKSIPFHPSFVVDLLRLGGTQLRQSTENIEFNGLLWVWLLARTAHTLIRPSLSRLPENQICGEQRQGNGDGPVGDTEEHSRFHGPQGCVVVRRQFPVLEHVVRRDDPMHCWCDYHHGWDYINAGKGDFVFPEKAPHPPNHKNKRHHQSDAPHLSSPPPKELAHRCLRLPYVCTPRCGGTTFWDRFAIKIIGHLEQLVPAAGNDFEPRDFSDKYRYPR